MGAAVEAQSTAEVKPDVWIWQCGKLIDKLEWVGTYNTAAVERTEEDNRVFVEQRKRISRFERWVKDHGVSRVGVVEHIEAPSAEPLSEVPSLSVAAAELPSEEEQPVAPQSGIDYGQRGIDDI